MPTLKDLEREIKFLSALKEVSSIYHEIANFQMRKIRKEVLSTREFLEGVSEVYHHVKLAFYKENREKGKKKMDFLEKNKKSVALFLSANERFYGPLIFHIWQKLLKELKEYDDLAVAGKIGKQLVQIQQTKKKFFYFELQDEKPKREEIQSLFNFIRRYKKIVIFYGKFQSIAFQEPQKTDITKELLSEKKFPSREKYLYYILEPSPEAILEFFEKEILEALFYQVISEHQLAKFASRMIAMYQTKENAQKNIGLLEKKARNLKKMAENKKQLQALAIFKIKRI